ncbi:hypothetical protein [Arcanobacterium phocae]|uniref:hypothetical protein n=1 Tax=Arcanobacterium phocae TaxID=131112 RepID=UPI001C0ED979|nr:hypothetical protein [Arcanobacterium phocae]
MKSQLEQHGAEQKKDGTSGTVKERVTGYFTFALVFLLLPFGTATFFAIEEGISSKSVMSGLVAFGVILTIGVVFELIAYGIYRWKNR